MVNLAEQLWQNAVQVAQTYQSKLRINTNSYQLLQTMHHQLLQLNLQTLTQMIKEPYRKTELTNYVYHIIDVPNNQCGLAFLYAWPLIDTTDQQRLSTLPTGVIDVGLVLPDYQVSQIKDLRPELDQTFNYYRNWCQLTAQTIQIGHYLPQQSAHHFIHQCWTNSRNHHHLNQ